VSKNSQNSSWRNFVKLTPTFIIFGKNCQDDIVMFGALIYHLT